MADGRMVVNTSHRCTRCGSEGPEGDMGTELWLCEHGVYLCFNCFLFVPCKPCVEAGAERERGRP